MPSTIFVQERTNKRWILTDRLIADVPTQGGRKQQEKTRSGPNMASPDVTFDTLELRESC